MSEVILVYVCVVVLHKKPTVVFACEHECKVVLHVPKMLTHAADSMYSRTIEAQRNQIKDFACVATADADFAPGP